MNIKQLNNNNIIITNNNTITFFSYETKILEYKNNTLELTNKWNYSKTILKYLYQTLDYIKDLVDYETRKIIEQILNSNNKKETINYYLNANKLKIN